MAKIRAGFVSNSSSSSFIIGLPNGDITEEVLSDALFGPVNDISDIGFGIGYDRGISADAALKCVFDDVKNTTPATVESLADTVHGLRYGSVPSFIREVAKDEPDYDMVVYGSKDYRVQRELSDEDRRNRWDHYSKLTAEWREKVAKLIIEHGEEKGVTWYVVEYSDDTSLGSTMEHGGVFDQMIKQGMCIRISNH